MCFVVTNFLWTCGDWYWFMYYVFTTFTFLTLFGIQMDWRMFVIRLKGFHASLISISKIQANIRSYHRPIRLIFKNLLKHVVNISTVLKCRKLFLYKSYLLVSCCFWSIISRVCLLKSGNFKHFKTSYQRSEPTIVLICFVSVEYYCFMYLLFL